MEKRPLKNLKPQEIYVVKGNYEGVDYYQLHLVLDNGIKLKQKLTNFEYKTLLGSNS